MGTVARTEEIERELDRLIERCSESKELDPDENEELWKASVRCYYARRNEEARAEWRSFHERMAAVHEDLACGHREQLNKLQEGNA